jgi:hypothetical protein
MVIGLLSKGFFDTSGSPCRQVFLLGLLLLICYLLSLMLIGLGMLMIGDQWGAMLSSLVEI